jgi:hypothetical protein
MPTRLFCPTCGRALTVSDNAPAQLTCPNCLARLHNPTAGQVRPLPVIPVDQEAQFDAARTTGLFYGLVGLLAVGTVLSIVNFGGASAIFNLVVAGALIGLIVLGLIVQSRRAKQRSTPPAADLGMGMLHPLAPGQPPLLPYGQYRPGPRPPPTNPLAAAGGFFAAIGVCAVGFFTLAATVDGYEGKHGLILLVVVTLVLLFSFSTPGLSNRPKWRGYGRGVMIGMCLGLLALAPCAFCYTMTLP